MVPEELFFQRLIVLLTQADDFAPQNRPWDLHLHMLLAICGALRCTSWQMNTPWSNVPKLLPQSPRFFGQRVHCPSVASSNE